MHVMKKFMFPHELFDRSFRVSEKPKINTTSLEKKKKKDETVLLFPHEICCKEPVQLHCESSNIHVKVLVDVSVHDAKKDENFIMPHDVDGPVMKKFMLPHELFDRSYRFSEKPKINTISLEKKKKDKTVLLLPHEIVCKEEEHVQPHCDSNSIQEKVLDVPAASKTSSTKKNEVSQADPSILSLKVEMPLSSCSGCRNESKVEDIMLLVNVAGTSVQLSVRRT